MPQLAKFDQRLVDFADQMERFNLILRQFDEIMINKVEKSSIKELKEVIKD